MPDRQSRSGRRMNPLGASTHARPIRLTPMLGPRAIAQRLSDPEQWSATRINRKCWYESPKTKNPSRANDLGFSLDGLKGLRPRYIMSIIMLKSLSSPRQRSLRPF